MKIFNHNKQSLNKRPTHFSILILCIILGLFFSNNIKAGNLDSLTVDTTSVNQDKFVQINTQESGFVLNMKYATDDNFLHTQVYPCAKCYLRPEAAKALLEAQKMALEQKKRIIIYDCYRPLSIQKKMFEIVPNEDWVANPYKRGSMHNKGIAVDVGLANMAGDTLEMGTAFDSFSPAAHYADTIITKTATANRKILRNIMIKAGFVPYENEWWHFNFPNTDYKNADFNWDCEKEAIDINKN